MNFEVDDRRRHLIFWHGDARGAVTMRHPRHTLFSLTMANTSFMVTLDDKLGQVMGNSDGFRDGASITAEKIRSELVEPFEVDIVHACGLYWTKVEGQPFPTG